MFSTWGVVEKNTCSVENVWETAENHRKIDAQIVEKIFFRMENPVEKVRKPI